MSNPAPDPAPPPAPRPRRPVFLALLVGGAVVAGVVGFRRWQYGRTHESTENAQVDAHIVPVIAKVGGFVRSVSAAENARVKAGDTLILIDDAELRVRVAQADADLLAARAIAGGRGIDGQSAAIERSAGSQRDALEAQLRAALATQQKAEADMVRLKDLADRQVISRQQLDAARWAVDNASALVTAAQRQITGASAGVANAEAGTRLARARLAAAEAARASAALQLSYAAITAPRGGFVSRKQVDPGLLVQPGQPLLTIVDDSELWITANFKETQLARLRVGQPVELEVDAYDGCVAQGQLHSLSAATGARFALLPPDNATGNFTKVVQRIPVKIRLTQGCGDARPLRPGMSVVVHVITDRA